MFVIGHGTGQKPSLPALVDYAKVSQADCHSTHHATSHESLHAGQCTGLPALNLEECIICFCSHEVAVLPQCCTGEDDNTLESRAYKAVMGYLWMTDGKHALQCSITSTVEDGPCYMPTALLHSLPPCQLLTVTVVHVHCIYHVRRMVAPRATCPLRNSTTLPTLV